METLRDVLVYLNLHFLYGKTAQYRHGHGHSLKVLRRLRGEEAPGGVLEAFTLGKMVFCNLDLNQPFNGKILTYLDSIRNDVIPRKLEIYL